MALRIVPLSVSHKFKRVRFLITISATVIFLFYYSFLNEENELNHKLHEGDLPGVTDRYDKEHDPDESIDLYEPKVLLEKNRYYPLVAHENSRSKVDIIYPKDYFENQNKIKLRKFKKEIRYDVGQENYFKLARLKKPHDYSTIQSSYFSDGGRADGEKLKRVKDAFLSSWKTYKDHGYGHDEVLPLAHLADDPFNGWSATLIDGLDTLLLIGEDKEFADAVQFIQGINFKQSFREDIPLFENVIRILGGLISAYDLSEEKILLQKAKEFATLLMEAFDTPNNMPLLYYRWRDELQNRFASRDAVLSEVGSLSLELSRLTQLTGDNKYYDAITRITNTFESSKNEFLLPGLYPNRIDISGCTPLQKQDTADGVQLNNPDAIKSIFNSNDVIHFIYCLISNHFKPAANTGQRYSLGALGDSFYEYLPKMYHLLRGNQKYATVYKEMYLAAREQIIETMLFRPKIPDSDNILFLSSITVMKSRDSIKIHQDLEMQHLTCFAGGMFALGSRLFNITEDITYAEKLTAGCAELYKRMKIMPEELYVDRQITRIDVYDEKERIEWIRSSGDVKPMPKIPVKRDTAAIPLENIGSTTKLPLEFVHGTPRPLGTLKVDAKGNTVWPVGGVANQPIWINEMDAKYLLRPEAIESVFYMYRITGDSKWREYGWMMWENTEKYCKNSQGEYAALLDVTDLENDANFIDSLESFWFSETLKYYYLLFEDIAVWSLDDYVFNTEAHPFKLVA